MIPTSGAQYRVGFFRDRGMEAKWKRTEHGSPIIFVRDPKGKLPHQRKYWWAVGYDVWKKMQEGEDPREVFDQHTMLGDPFSVPG